LKQDQISKIYPKTGQPSNPGSHMGKK